MFLARHVSWAIWPPSRWRPTAGEVWPAAIRSKCEPTIRCDPVWALVAGWPVQCEDFFAMGSGPMRMLRGREPMLEELALSREPARTSPVSWKPKS